MHTDQGPQRSPAPDRRLYAGDILASENITDRALRKWIARGRFPSPDGNLNGRNFWFQSTYQRWKADVLAGRYSQQRRPGVACAAAVERAAL